MENRDSHIVYYNGRCVSNLFGRMKASPHIFEQSDVEVSVVLPCRDEEDALAICIQQIQAVFTEHSIVGEIIVSDSSTDRSPDIARELGTVLVKHDLNGYGRAYAEGFKAVRGRYIFCADPDASYDFREIPRFIAALKKAPDSLIIGNRFGFEMGPQAMPWLHKVVGRPLFSLLLKLFFRINVPDVHCGMRAFCPVTLKKLELRTVGMEMASEMLIKAHQNNVAITVLPIHYTARLGDSKLKTFRDGWRHTVCILEHWLSRRTYRTD